MSSLQDFKWWMHCLNINKTSRAGEAMSPHEHSAVCADSKQWLTPCWVVAHRETRRHRCSRLNSGSCSTLFISLGSQSDTDNQDTVRANYMSQTQRAHCGSSRRFFYLWAHRLLALWVCCLNTRSPGTASQKYINNRWPQTHIHLVVGACTMTILNTVVWVGVQLVLQDKALMQ